MTRYEVTLRLRPLPWPIRLLRQLVGGSGGSFTAASSESRADIWFALLVPYAWRSAHRRWAGRHRYFWLPCPLCGREFGGHERDHLTGKPSSVPDPTHPPCYASICPPCVRAGRGVR